MKLRYFCCLLLLVSGVSCTTSTFTSRDLYVSRDTPCLPGLILDLDEEGFQAVYRGARYVPAQDSSLYQPDFFVVRQSSRERDARILCERIFIGNLIEPKARPVGTLVITPVFMNLSNRAPVLTIGAAVSLGVLTVLGVPHGVYRMDVEYQAEVYDADGLFVARYIGHGRAKRTVGLYYGGSDFTRTLHVEATRLALDEIAGELRKDCAFLTDELK
ncbi:MAG: hypothetical protein SF053_09900 [Bacteroidia bacterium]|nr:hypothetical protein [Bacteroidia bacterium]